MMKDLLVVAADVVVLVEHLAEAKILRPHP